MKKLRKKFDKKFYSIGTSIMLYFVLLICIVILLVSTISYSYSVRDLEQVSVSYTQGLIAEINAAVNSYIDNIKSMSLVICENPDVQELMKNYNNAMGKGFNEDESTKIAELEKSVANHLRIVAKTRSEITNIALISKYDDIILNSEDKSVNPNAEYKNTDWFIKPLTYKDNIVVSPSHVQNLVQDEYTWVISISRAILDASTGEVTGIMVIDLNFYAIQDICQTAELGQNGYAYIIDDDKNIIYHPQQQLIYAGVKQEPFDEILNLTELNFRTDTNKIYTKNRSQLTGWTAVGVVNASELMQARDHIITFYFTLSVACLIGASLAAMFIASSITRPLKELEATMHRVEDGDLSMRATTDINNEIGHLGHVFNVMIAKLKALMDTAVANEEIKRKSELKALQAQINPHFLYNTLDSIIWMSASGKSEEVTDMTEALAKLFRTSISQGETDTPLLNEMENVKSYLTIQQMRYGEKLSFELDVNGEFLDCRVPKLILQPIVENAIYHGIKLSPTNGKIYITAYKENEKLIILVKDTGVGMTAEEINNLFNENKMNKDADHGIGVLNVHNRIKLFYGEGYGLSYQSEKDVGTTVKITLPLSRSTREEQNA